MLWNMFLYKYFIYIYIFPVGVLCPVGSDWLIHRYSENFPPTKRWMIRW